ncbi:MAG: hypothetical protein KME29_26195 [Calothrix sp. FI2-JRJ7]|jgi:hypothetical protein|nr:hypothetical protein [Calothrix sp. FI2-JRJ7]
MNYQFKLLQYLVAFTVLFTLPTVKALAQNTPPLGSGQSTDKIILDGVSNVFAVQQGYANNSTELLSTPSFSFIQNVERVATWEKVVRLDKLPTSLEVTYEQPGIFTNTDGSNGMVNVTVEHVQADIFSQNANENSATIRGQVRFKFDPTRATSAGAYNGTLRICIKSKDGVCLQSIR